MSITLTLPDPAHTPSWHVGPGVTLVGSLSGPNPVDDFIYVTVNDAFNGQIAVVGKVLHYGGGNGWAVTLGAGDTLPISNQTTLLNATLSVDISRYNAAGILQDSVNYPGCYQYDPVGALWSLLGSGGGTLQAILDAVTRTYT
jgi:hypothetical protein